MLDNCGGMNSCLCDPVVPLPIISAIPSSATPICFCPPSPHPGDIVVVSPGKIAFDAILLEGECVVDETVLTGGSVPASLHSAALPRAPCLTCC
jgi:hypothetical protein